MTSTNSLPDNQERNAGIAYGVVASLIASGLVAGGVWLANHQVPDETSLQFTFSESRVNKLSAWYVKIVNNSDVAFDLKLTPPSSSIIRVEYSPKSDGGQRIDSAQVWTGQIAKGHALETLYISEDPNVRLSSAVVQGSVKATYQERNPTTGVIENRDGEVRDAVAFPALRTASIIFWFLLPILAAGFVVMLPRLAKGVRERLKASGKSN
ncbi:Flp pilus assembly pilin Flp [Pseudomonas hunanensis]|uniref:Flp pilus assembly pilin Flp n=1 Tax=Pseudomonas hunanensis TaxID=1247546 RepID=A0ACC6K766_9PSED|nr:hypothetical protein [Pseudomonas hunanensis]MDR6714257.1 Flp pilus assembly pilin Flp [Pseudomonas hunanensis]